MDQYLKAEFLLNSLPDIFLLLISALACLFCALLHRRLKRLNDLKSGVGASIVSLTNAIETIHKSAKDTQSTTLEMTTTLRHMLEKAETALTNLEAKKIEMENEVKKISHATQKARTESDTLITNTIKQAKDTAAQLNDIMADLQAFQKECTALLPIAKRSEHDNAAVFESDYEASFQEALSTEKTTRLVTNTPSKSGAQQRMTVVK